MSQKRTEICDISRPLLPRGAIAFWYAGDGKTLFLLPSGMYVACDGVRLFEVSQKWAAQQHLVALMSEMTLTPHAAALMLGVPCDVLLRWWGGEETLTEEVIRRLQRRTRERTR